MNDDYCSCIGKKRWKGSTWKIYTKTRRLSYFEAVEAVGGTLDWDMRSNPRLTPKNQGR